MQRPPALPRHARSLILCASEVADSRWGSNRTVAPPVLVPLLILGRRAVATADGAGAEGPPSRWVRPTWRLAGRTRSFAQPPSRLIFFQASGMRVGTKVQGPDGHARWTSSRRSWRRAARRRPATRRGCAGGSFTWRSCARTWTARPRKRARVAQSGAEILARLWRAAFAVLRGARGLLPFYADLVKAEASHFYRFTPKIAPTYTFT